MQEELILTLASILMCTRVNMHTHTHAHATPYTQKIRWRLIEEDTDVDL